MMDGIHENGRILRENNALLREVANILRSRKD